MGAAGNPSREALVERARGLALVLRERADEAIQARRIPDATIADMANAGFYRMLQPAGYGGYESDPRAFCDVLIALAAACPSSAWVLGVIGVHSWQLALFDPTAQEEVWGQDASTLISSSYMPVGRVTRVDGGFRLSGRWGFSSGCDHCRWVFLGAFVPTDGGPPDMRTFLVPRTDYRIEDVWHVSGLQATGSNDIVVDDVFVPEHRTHRFRDGFTCDSPGHAVNQAPLYRLPFGQIFVRSVGTPAVGMLEGALEAYVDYQGERVGRGDGAKAAADPAAQIAAAQGAATVDAARLLLERDFGEMMAMAEAGERIPIERRVAFRYNSSRVVADCVAAVDTLFEASGGGAIFRTNPINRFFQDIHAARAHYANYPAKPGRNYGGVLLGAKTTDFFI